MTLKPLFYFVVIRDNKLRSFDSHLVPVQKPLHGLYSSLYFPNLIVIGYMLDYGSQHNGLHTMLKVLSAFTIKYRHHLFVHQPKGFRIPQDPPIAGGSMLLCHNEIVFWHLKSGSFSQNNINCPDKYPHQLISFMQTLHLPANRYITIEQAESFEKHALRSLFTSDGQYKHNGHAEDDIEIICRDLHIPQLSVPVPDMLQHGQ